MPIILELQEAPEDLVILQAPSASINPKKGPSESRRRLTPQTLDVLTILLSPLSAHGSIVSYVGFRGASATDWSNLTVVAQFALSSELFKLPYFALQGISYLQPHSSTIPSTSIHHSNRPGHLPIPNFYLIGTDAEHSAFLPESKDKDDDDLRLRIKDAFENGDLGDCGGGTTREILVVVEEGGLVSPLAEVMQHQSLGRKQFLSPHAMVP